MALKTYFFLGVHGLIRNILVAVDGSENSYRAMDFALDLAEKYSAAVTVLNVSESPAMGAVPIEPTTVSGESMVVFAKDLRRFHEDILSKAVDHARKVKPNVAVSSKLREGIRRWRLLLSRRRVWLMLLWLGMVVWVG